VRAPIKTRGGRRAVSGVTFDNESYEAIVTFNIDTRTSFRGYFGEILTSGLLGEQYVGLEAGGTGDAEGRRRLRLTQSAVVLET